MLKKRAVSSFWLQSMFYTLLQRVSLFAFGILSYLILVRGFSTTTNGIWSLYITFFSLFEAVKQGLLRNSTIKFMALAAGSAVEKQAVQTASLVINSGFSVLAVAGIIVFGQPLAGWLQADGLWPLLLWSTLLVLLLVPYNHCEILLQAAYRFNILFRAAFFRQALFFAGLIIVYLWFPERFNLLNVLLLQSAALLAATLYIVGCTRATHPVSWKYQSGWVNKLFHFGKYTFGTNLFAGLARSVDHFLTAAVLGPVAGKEYVAYYNTVARINNIVDVPALAASDVLYPKNVEVLEKDGPTKVKYYFEQVTGTLLAMIVPISLGIFLFPRAIVWLIAGPDYYPVVPLLQITILFSLVRPLSYQFGSTLDAIGKPGVNFRVNAVFMLMSLALNYFFLQTYGGVGAAYAMALFYLITLVVMIAVLKKYLGISLAGILRAGWQRYRDIWAYLRSRLAGRHSV